MSSHKNRLIKNIFSSILVVLILFLSFITLLNLTINFTYIKTNVRGFSMQPTINMNVENKDIAGDTIYISKRMPIKNNDIIVAKPTWFENYIIKRVIGIPGDKIEIKDEETHYAVYVNDKVLYTKEKYGDVSSFDNTGSIGVYANYRNFLESNEFKDYVDETKSYIKLDDGEYFLMGDNWGHSLDCMTKGPIKASEIIGKVELIVDTTNDNPFYVTQHFLKKIFSKF